MRQPLTLFIGLICFARMAPGQDGESNVTVRVFSIHVAREVTFSPLGSGNVMRMCPQCPQAKIGTPVTLKQVGDELQILGGSKGDSLPHKQLELRGAFRVHIEGSSEVETAAGRWVVDKDTSGLRILLTTSTERYVIAALNGEAAADEPLESLKAMAVVARTFALANAHGHAAEGFDFCDNTHCQALRIGPTRPDVEEAVRATTGETLWDGTHRAEAYTTQHCGGEAEDASSVWPAIHAPYLHAHPDPYCLRRSTASWHANINIAQLARILREQHWKVPEQIETIRVTKRTPTGRAQMLEVLGQETRSEISASSLHFALDRALGWNQLRSDWYQITLNNGVSHFEGKGYGHGVGLCQTGSFEMAAEGRNYRGILSFYFPGTQLRITAKDAGWQEISGAGWTLAATDPSQDFLQMGNLVWAKAQSIFPPNATVHPIVRLMPSAELFRQATDEPGWMLASTRGIHIVLQPLPVLRANAGESPTLLHEFLHVLVEEEAASQTPLWLREGLVEVVAGNRHQTSGAMPVSEIEASLAHPATLIEAQRAHAASEQFVQGLIDKYGLQMVRGWLRSGVPSTALAQ